MSAVNLIVVVESVRSIITHKKDDSDTNNFHIPSIVAVGAALGVKFLLFLYCLSLRKASSQVEVLWEDHRNDLFINSFGELFTNNAYSHFSMSLVRSFDVRGWK